MPFQPSKFTQFFALIIPVKLFSDFPLPFQECNLNYEKFLHSRKNFSLSCCFTKFQNLSFLTKVQFFHQFFPSSYKKRDRKVINNSSMSGSAGSTDSWHPVLTTRTATSDYWFNWRVLLCAIWVLICSIFSLVLLWKHEGFRKLDRESEESQEERAGSLYEDETWKPCLKGVHPAWLLAFRLVAFIVLVVMLVVTILLDGGGSIFYFYTQWTFTLITIYFGLGTLLSLYGCHKYHKTVSGDRVDNVEVDSEQGKDQMTSAKGEAASSSAAKTRHPHEEAAGPIRKRAGIWGYLFQIIFQMNAGAVLLTDCVFWFIIVPFLAIKDYSLNVLTINMHTMNAVFLFGDAALNCLRFPWFRLAYVFLWTVLYVLFQWTVHACINIWWPYPFLDLSSPYAPLWYLSVAVMHIPCYAAFALVIKLKHRFLSRWFPESYQCIG